MKNKMDEVRELLTWGCGEIKITSMDAAAIVKIVEELEREVADVKELRAHNQRMLDYWKIGPRERFVEESAKIIIAQRELLKESIEELEEFAGAMESRGMEMEDTRDLVERIRKTIGEQKPDAI